MAFGALVGRNGHKRTTRIGRPARPPAERGRAGGRSQQRDGDPRAPCHVRSLPLGQHFGSPNRSFDAVRSTEAGSQLCHGCSALVENRWSEKYPHGRKYDYMTRLLVADASARIFCN